MTAIAPQPCFPVGHTTRVRHREASPAFFRPATAAWLHPRGSTLVRAIWRPGAAVPVVSGWSSPRLSARALRVFLGQLRDRPLSLIRLPKARLLWPGLARARKES
jgi:hypothetical protein